MNDLRVCVLQADLIWEDTSANLAMFEKLIVANKEGADVVVLPEMFNTGFSMKSGELAQPMDGEVVSWIRRIASESGCVITGSTIIEEEGQFYNRLIWAQPDGEIVHYDKRHLFRMADEEKFYSGGSERLICELNGWRICPLVCYDLRFPVWSRNNKRDYDVLLYVANWPAVRGHVWSTLLLARAMENQAYVVGCNRVGKDDNDIAYSGGSVIVDAKGEVIASGNNEEAGVVKASLSYQDLEDFREKFPVHLDADDFELK